MTLLRCVDPVCGLRRMWSYEVMGKKVHPLTGQELLIVKEVGGDYPNPDDRRFGFLPSRFEELIPERTT